MKWNERNANNIMNSIREVLGKLWSYHHKSTSQQDFFFFFFFFRKQKPTSFEFSQQQISTSVPGRMRTIPNQNQNQNQKKERKKGESYPVLRSDTTVRYTTKQLEQQTTTTTTTRKNISSSTDMGGTNTGSVTMQRLLNKYK